jgi:methanogenic corrinoid protein MtbC1
VFQAGNLPTDDLVWSVDAFGADLLMLSATRFGDAPAVRDAIARVRAARQAAGKPPVPVLVGGAAFVGSQDLWKEVRADAFAARARDAVAVAAKLVDVGRTATDG